MIKRYIGARNEQIIQLHFTVVVVGSCLSNKIEEILINFFSLCAVSDFLVQRALTFISVKLRRNTMLFREKRKEE